MAAMVLGALCRCSAAMSEHAGSEETEQGKRET